MQERGNLTSVLAAIAVVALLARPHPVLAEDKKPFREVGNWSIYQNETNCSAVSLFEDSEGVVIFYDASDRSTWVAFTDVDATSIADGDERMIDILLRLPNGAIDDGWEATEFTVNVGDDGRRMFVSQALDEPALSDFKRSTTIAFFYKDRRIGAYNLAGSAAALTEVERCSQRLHGINPRDVFAGE